MKTESVWQRKYSYVFYLYKMPDNLAFLPKMAIHIKNNKNVHFQFDET